MKRVIFVSLLLAMTACVYTYVKHASDKQLTVNAIIGDASFIETYGHEPDLNTSEHLRIKTHLEYVGRRLRQKDITHLSPELRKRRNHLLGLLHNYSEAGIFPRNYDYKQSRKPCFIDKDGKICAVGYLVEQTAGRKIAEAINSRHKYEALLAMNDNVVDGWIEGSGLSKEECALIQPTYGGVFPEPTPPKNNITPAYGISSSALSGVNVSVNTLMLQQRFKGANNKALGVIGMIAGGGQVILGASQFPKTTTDPYGNTTYRQGRKTLSMLNIGLGTTTLFLSGWKLMADKKPKNTKTTWNVSGFETPNCTIGMAVTFSRRL